MSSFKSNGQSFKIQYIELSRAGDVFVDEVYIGQGPSTLDQGKKTTVYPGFFGLLSIFVADYFISQKIKHTENMFVYEYCKKILES